MAVGFDTTKPSARMKFHKPTLLPQAIGHHTPAVRTLFGLATGAARVLRRTRKGGKRRGKASLSSGMSGRRRRSTSARGGSKSGRRTRHLSSGSRSTRRRSSRKAAHLVKGSAAAKRHMSSIRKLRGKGK